MDTVWMVYGWCMDSVCGMYASQIELEEEMTIIRQ